MKRFFSVKGKRNMPQFICAHRCGHFLAGAFFVLLTTLPVAAPAQTTVIVDRPVVVPISTLTINDIDFLKATTPKLIFSIGMRTSDGSTVQASMSLTLNIFLANGENFLRAIYLETKPPDFTIPGARTITNLDLGSSIPVRSETNEAAKSRLKEIALPSGSVPAGRYQFVINLRAQNAAVTILDPSFEISITNPSAIELALPLMGEELTTRFPLFQWRYDGDARIFIFEKLDGQSSLEDAASGVPMLSAFSSTQSYQYPSSGVRSLLPGKTYVWYVEGLSPTSGGTSIPFKSEVRWFSLASEEGVAAVSGSDLLDELERALPARYRPIIQQLREQQYLPQEGFRYNGRIITNTDLLRLLNRLRANEDAVTSVTLE
jgi:hypothetical protein